MIKHFKYLWYIIRHKWYVLCECWVMGLYWRGLVHDLSKTLPSEWFPYTRYFYGDYPKLEDISPAIKWMYTGYYSFQIEDQFNLAWLKHIHRNPHHWQYWILREDSGNTFPIPMPEIYMKEMLADWRGAGKAITGKDNTPEWYEKNKGNMQLHLETREWIEKNIK